MKLVDSLAEQEELESILEASKPPARATARQHYLLSTPFRYPSPHPSRFRPAGALGVWYGAESVETACTELAYWRWRFLMDSEGLRRTELIAEFSLFRAKVNGSAVDLSVEPWDARRADWTSDDYCGLLGLGRRSQTARGPMDSVLVGAGRCWPLRSGAGSGQPEGDRDEQAANLGVQGFGDRCADAPSAGLDISDLRPSELIAYGWRTCAILSLDNISSLSRY